MFNSTFYPTPTDLIDKMIAKIKKEPSKFLEPQAGKADIINRMASEKYSRWGGHTYPLENFSAIEKDPDLRALLRGKGINVLDSDFLTYSGSDQFDLIIMNPPFDHGDIHLLKAIDIMYRGEIVCLLNAEMLRDLRTNTRKVLVKKLDVLEADIEYMGSVFKNAERPTDVEVALVYIDIKKTVEEDLFAGCDDTTVEIEVEHEENHEVSTGMVVEELVAEHNQIIEIGKSTILDYYRNFPKIGHYVKLDRNDEGAHYKGGDMTAQIKDHINNLIMDARKDFWRRTLNIQEVKKRMTENKQKEFEVLLVQRYRMDFTENNIRQFILNLIGGYEQTLTEAVVDVFDMFTVRHCYEDGIDHGNVHMFNGWKTNKSFRVNKKIIIPIGYNNGLWGGPFSSSDGTWKMDYQVPHKTQDIDVVMSYFDGLSYYLSIGNALEVSLKDQQSKGIVSTYFTMNAHKKGTLHLAFNSDDILRRFNVVACKGKGWLPGNYGSTAYSELSHEEKEVVNSFEGEKSYNENLNQPLFALKNLLQIAV